MKLVCVRNYIDIFSHMHGLLYVTASPLTDQPCDHDMLLRQSKGSSDNCVNSLLTRCVMIMLTAV